MIAFSRSSVLPFFALLVLFVVQMQVCAAPLVAAVDVEVTSGTNSDGVAADGSIILGSFGTESSETDNSPVLADRSVSILKPGFGCWRKNSSSDSRLHPYSTNSNNGWTPFLHNGTLPCFGPGPVIVNRTSLLSGAH